MGSRRTISPILERRPIVLALVPAAHLDDLLDGLISTRVGVGVDALGLLLLEEVDDSGSITLDDCGRDSNDCKAVDIDR